MDLKWQKRATRITLETKPFAISAPLFKDS